MIGNSIEAVGIDETAALPGHLPRYLPTSGSIQGIAIPGKWSSSESSISRITVTNHETRQCGNNIRSRQCKKRLLSGGNLSRKARPPRVHSHRKGEAKTFRGQPRPLHSKDARKFKIPGSSHSQPSVSRQYKKRLLSRKNR
jgi:hypothetical protein